MSTQHLKHEGAGVIGAVLALVACWLLLASPPALAQSAAAQSPAIPTPGYQLSLVREGNTLAMGGVLPGEPAREAILAALRAVEPDLAIMDMSEVRDGASEPFATAAALAATLVMKLKPGAVLSEQALSASTGFGRTPIREALQRLARQGLVTILPRKGILVADLNPRNQLLLMEVRREIERLLSRAGAERATPEQRTELEGIARGMDAAAASNDDISFMRLDREMNALMLDAAHNEYAARSAKLFQGLARRYWYMHYRVAADLPLCERLHAAQARAIAKGNPAAAAAASDKLMDYVETFTRTTVSV